jgi:hypothetical protein
MPTYMLENLGRNSPLPEQVGHSLEVLYRWRKRPLEIRLKTFLKIAKAEGKDPRQEFNALLEQYGEAMA